MRGLTTQQQAILRHINAYCTSEVAAIAVDCCPNLTLNAVTKKLKRLDERRYVQLIGDKHDRHVRLGVSSIKEFDFSSHRTKLPGPESLPRDLAIVRHCVFGQPPRDRLSANELRAIFTDFPDHLVSIPFYIDPKRQQLVAIYVLGSVNAESFLDRLEAERHRFLSSGGTFARLQRERRIRFDAITPDEIRKRELEKLVPPSFPVDIDVCRVPPIQTSEGAQL